MMRTPAPLGMIPTSPPREADDRSAWAAPGLMQTRLTRNLAWRTSRGIPWAHGTLRRSRNLFPTTIGRPPRRVRGVYTGLSNTRSPDRGSVAMGPFRPTAGPRDTPLAALLACG
jgi:hypothetical protein